MNTESVLLGEASVRLGITESALRRALRDGVIQVPRAGGRFFVFNTADLPRLKARLVESGYTTPTVVRPEPVATA